MSKKTIVFDFDGVIHKYSKGWQDGSIYDKPNENIKETIKKLRANNYEVVVVSTRCSTEEGIDAIRNWLFDNGIVVDKVCKEKPPALVYIDDRAICYDPNSSTLYEQIINFEPYQKSLKKYEEMNELELLGYLSIQNKLFQEVNNQLEAKYPAKDNPIISIKIMDDWIKAVQKYL